MASRAIRNRLKVLLHRAFRLGQRFGIDVLPRHFYSSIPDLRELENDLSWRNRRSMVGVRGAEIAPQLQFAQQCCSPHREELLAIDVHRRAVTEADEVGYGVIEADFLHCFIRTFRPKRIIQVGCGVSTAVILLAAGGRDVQVTCIEPYPSRFLQRMHQEGRIGLIAQKAQQVPVERMLQLSAGDLFFVDSTHTVKPGSEVNQIVLEVLPRLTAGVHVHFHDIYFPYDYSRHVFHELFWPNESVLLHAFLAGNSGYRISCSLSMLHHAAPAEFERLLPRYQPAPMDRGLRTAGSEVGHFPSATYCMVDG
jgi:predicted O-methyltransferase YrrM